MKNTVFSLIKVLLILLLSMSVSACFVRPYKFDLEQGNDLTLEKINQVQEGMSEEQVRYVLGTPMLHDVFHMDRWDYIYYEKPAYSEPIRQHIAIYFRDGRVDRITKDTLPSAA